VFCICASVLYLCKCFVFVQVFCICASVLYLCKCFVFVQVFCPYEPPYFSEHLESVLHYPQQKCLVSNIIYVNQKPRPPIVRFFAWLSGLEDYALMQSLLPVRILSAPISLTLLVIPAIFLDILSLFCSHPNSSAWCLPFLLFLER